MIAAPGFGVEEEAVNYSIYKWSCLNDDCNHIYVGSAKDVAKRRAEHVRACEDATSKYHNVKQVHEGEWGGASLENGGFGGVPRRVQKASGRGGAKVD